MGSNPGGAPEERGRVGDVPPATLTLDEFRAQFTEAHREALLAATLAQYQEARALLVAHGLTGPALHVIPQAATATAREALQLLGALHPQPFTW